MIQQVTGDILKTKAQAIAHGVAPGDHFNQGLALSLRERYPAMFQDFRHYCHQQHPKPGTCWLWAGPGAVLVSLFTQEPVPTHSHAHPGKAKKESVNHVLRQLAKLIKKEKLTSIALPRLATGVGGLDWSDVLPLIEHHLGDIGIPVIVYSTFHAGQQAKEKI